MGLLDKLIKEGSKLIEEVATEENKEKAAEFLTNLKDGISDIAKEVGSEENKEKAADFLNNLKENLGGVGEELKKAVGEANLEELKNAFKAEEKEEIDESFYEEDEDQRPVEEKIVEVLKTEFPDYTYEENFSPAKLGGEGKFMDYSFLVCKDGEPKLAMMLIGKTTCSHREYRWSKEFAEGFGLPFINFIRHYPNKVEYIKQRLHKYL